MEGCLKGLYTSHMGMSSCLVTLCQSRSLGWSSLGSFPALLSNTASAVLIPQWLDSLRCLYGHSCSKLWCSHTCFTISVCTWSVSPPLSISHTEKASEALLASLKRRHLDSGMLMLFQWTHSAFSDFIDPQKWILPLSSIRKSRKALDNGSALHAAPLEICSTRENDLDSVRPVKLLSTGWPWGWGDLAVPMLGGCQGKNSSVSARLAGWLGLPATQKWGIFSWSWAALEPVFIMLVCWDREVSQSLSWVHRGNFKLQPCKSATKISNTWIA